MIVVPSKMGCLNKRALLWRLQRMGLASRADLAKTLGISQPTAGKIVDELLELGVLEEVDGEIVAGLARTKSRQAKLGRPGRIVRLNRCQPRFLGIQLGVSDTNLALLPLGANEEDRWRVRVKTSNSAESWARQLQEAAVQLEANTLWGVLVSVPGIVDEPAGRVVFSPNLHWTEQADLARLVQRVWNVPVELVQEERALALGQQFADPSSDDFLLVDFGDGVGGAMIVGGQLFNHPLPISGELGHTPVMGNQRSCGCGAVGCMETLVSTRGLLQSYAAISQTKAPTWSGLVSHLEKQGVQSWLAEALEGAAVVIAGALNVLGLHRVVITGSLTELPLAVMEYLAQTIEQGTMWARFGKLECLQAPRRRSAGLVAVGIDRLVLPMTERDKIF
jgi:predicted NBD/HSP70 family sugar kinase